MVGAGVGVGVGVQVDPICHEGRDAITLTLTYTIALTLTLAPPLTLALHTMNAETPNMSRRVKTQKPMIT